MKLTYQNGFYGWMGKIAEGFTYPSVYEIATTLANYYKKNSFSGQKLVVAYDNRVFAKDFASFLSSIMASKGIKVFFCNKIAPSSVGVVSSLHKKSMGTVIITGDAFSYQYLGIRAVDNQGYFLNEEDLQPYQQETNKKEKNIQEYATPKTFENYISKGFIEPFDPLIPYENHIEKTFDFSSIAPNWNFILYNPLQGSGVYYFDRILSQKKLCGYSIMNQTDMTYGFQEPNPFGYKDFLYENMITSGAGLGVNVSPDCSSICFLVGPHVLSHHSILYLLCEHLHKQGILKEIIIADTIKINTHSFSHMTDHISVVPEKEFYSTLKKEPYSIALDSYGRIYFGHHGIPDGLLTTYMLFQIFNDSQLEPAMLHHKLEQVKSVIQL